MQAVKVRSASSLPYVQWEGKRLAGIWTQDCVPLASQNCTRAPDLCVAVLMCNEVYASFASTFILEVMAYLALRII